MDFSRSCCTEGNWADCLVKRLQIIRRNEMEQKQFLPSVKECSQRRRLLIQIGGKVNFKTIYINLYINLLRFKFYMSFHMIFVQVIIKAVMRKTLRTLAAKLWHEPYIIVEITLKCFRNCTISGPRLL